MTPNPEPAERAQRYVVVAHDPEIYQTIETTDIVRAWTELMFCPVECANKDEVEQFRCWAIDPDNWHLDHDGIPSYLCWEVSGEGGGKIEFYRLTEPHPTTDPAPTAAESEPPLSESMATAKTAAELHAEYLRLRALAKQDVEDLNAGRISKGGDKPCAQKNSVKQTSNSKTELSGSLPTEALKNSTEGTSRTSASKGAPKSDPSEAPLPDIGKAISPAAESQSETGMPIGIELPSGAMASVSDPSPELLSALDLCAQAARNMVLSDEFKGQSNEDSLDMMRDEFRRIAAICNRDAGNETLNEILFLCARGMEFICQKAPVIEQRDAAQREAQQLRRENERLKAMHEMFRDENNALVAANQQRFATIDNIRRVLLTKGCSEGRTDTERIIWALQIIASTTTLPEQ